jgi:hypothetical protein
MVKSLGDRLSNIGDGVRDTAVSARNGVGSLPSRAKSVLGWGKRTVLGTLDTTASIALKPVDWALGKREPVELHKGVKSLDNTVSGIFRNIGDKVFGGATSVSGPDAAATRSVLDRTAGVASGLLKPVKWITGRPFLGSVVLLGGAATAAMAVKNHYDRKREAVNAMGLDPSQMQYPSYANSVSPEEYAQMEAKMRASASPQFAQAEAEKRTASPTQQPQPAAISPL